MNIPFSEDQAIAWETTGPGVKRKIMTYNEQLMLVKVDFEAGAIGVLHHHYHSQLSFVAEGVFEVAIGAEKKVLKAGDVFHVEPDIVHGVVCLEKGMLVDIFNPYREDFVR